MSFKCIFQCHATILAKLNLQGTTEELSTCVLLVKERVLVVLAPCFPMEVVKRMLINYVVVTFNHTKVLFQFSIVSASDIPFFLANHPELCNGTMSFELVVSKLVHTFLDPL